MVEGIFCVLMLLRPSALPQTLWEAGSREGGGGGGHMVDGRDSAWRNRAPGPHAHRNTARQAMDGLWIEARGPQKQSNDPANNQHILNTPIIGHR